MTYHKPSSGQKGYRTKNQGQEIYAYASKKNYFIKSI